MVGSGAAEAPDNVALNTMGQAMVEQAGDDIQVYTSTNVIRKYILGDMTTTVYPVGGSFEDWAYAAGWDSDLGAAFKKCTAMTY